MTFYIDDYNSYSKKNRMLRRFKELEKKKSEWEITNQEMVQRQKLDLTINNYLFDICVSKKITEDEEGEIYNIEMELDERLLDLNPKELSLEQWSFIKSLYPTLDEFSFFEIVTSLSKPFIEQLNFREDSNSARKDFLVIKNKFINHCNLIASGGIQFSRKEE